MSRNHEVETKNLPPVNKAVKEYRVIEDGAYAYHLQEQEIENHYAQNVYVRRTVMEDIQQAKALQDEEDRKARILTLDEQDELEQMDEQLAGIIQEDIYKRNLQETEKRKERESRDQELALLLEEKERRRSEQGRRAMEQDHAIAERLQKLRVTPSPTSNHDEQRMKLMSDKELARRLQEEEKLKAEREKQKKKNIKSVIEMQDEELAKYIHEKDIEAAEIKFGRKRSKKKGKWKDEPLYYDDNFSPPPQYQEAPPPARNHSSNKKGPSRPPPPMFSDAHITEVKVPLDSSQQSHHRQRNSPELRPDVVENGRHSPHDRRQAYSEKQGRYRGSSDELDQPARYSPHDRRNVHGEKHRRRRGSADELDKVNENRRSSERHRSTHTPQDDRRLYDQSSRLHHPPDSREDIDQRNHRHNEPQRSHERHQCHDDPWQMREDRHPRRPEPVPKSRTPRDKKKKEKKTEQAADDELNYNENFTRLTEEELGHYNNNIEHNKSRKKSNCKQQ